MASAPSDAPFTREEWFAILPEATADPPDLFPSAVAATAHFSPLLASMARGLAWLEKPSDLAEGTRKVPNNVHSNGETPFGFVIACPDDAPQQPMNINVGDVIPFEAVETVNGKTVSLRGGEGLVHFYLGRFSGCPACNFLYKQYYNQRADFEAAGVTNVFVIHSEAKTILANQGDKFGWAKEVNFVADPSRKLYRKLGAEMTLSALATTYMATVVRNAFGQFRVEDEGVGEGRTQRPLELLIDAATGKVLAKYYGAKLNDAWVPKRLIEIVEEYRAKGSVQNGDGEAFR
ncbi:hypothetical protein DFJ74DRAFT_766702 [Hyaloraphidium curvatum]|nr:hypothetical protein DFJ74DRAFT_766702 [Hyaloraphidium curvatum]